FNQMSEQVHNLDEARNQFVSNASHELKTPLATIKILVESMMYQDDMDPALRKEFLGDIDKEIDRLSSVVGDLLTLVHIDSHKLRLRREMMVLADTVRETVSRLNPLAKKRGQQIVVKIQDECEMFADSGKLAQVCYNIIENAIKYTPDGGTITVSLAKVGRDAVLDISDTGVGIPAEDLPHVFDRFYRVDKARSRETGGTGLGLSIVKQIVRLHAGTVTVASGWQGHDVHRAAAGEIIGRRSDEKSNRLCAGGAGAGCLCAAARRAKAWFTKQAERPNAPGVTFESQLGVKQESNLIDVTLYFRYGDTNLLGAVGAQLDAAGETVAQSIVEALLVGPDAAHDRLSGVFPQGTEVISVQSEGDTAYVTLNRAFLGIPNGAPADWEDLEAWQTEATLRRRLAYESIVLALTEDGRFQRVQLYVAGGDDEIPQRIPLYWFDRSVSDTGVMLAACARDEQAILTPKSALELMLAAWQKQDWEALYALVLREEETPTLSGFESQMRETNVQLMTYESTSGTVSLDGQRATVVLDAAIHSDEGGDAQIVRESVPLIRQSDHWCVALATLESLMIRD
ncbi:MAG: ATP-binding protein, partial [Christensenellales bacterium]